MNVDTSVKTDVQQDQIAEILDGLDGQPLHLISILEKIQEKFGYLSDVALREVAERTRKSLVDVYGVATFYKNFRLKPRGKHLVSICLGTACHVQGGPAVAEEFGRQLGIKSGETSADGEFSLEAVNCLGACALGPVVLIDGKYHAKVTPARVAKIIRETKEEVKEKVEVKPDERVFPLELNCPRCNHSLMDAKRLVDGLPSVRMTVSFEDQHCGLSLSCLYGSFNISSQVEIPMNTIMHFFCPHCYGELIGATNCTTCGAPMVPMVIQGGGMVQVCARRGCKEHRLDLDGVNV